jgi:hypothetical protein
MLLNCSESQLDQGIINYVEEDMLVQDAFNFLTADEREFLISGLLTEEFEYLSGDKNHFIPPLA